MYEDVFVPTNTLLKYHWYAAVPPFTAVAVKVTGEPWHAGFVGVDMLTLAGIPVLTTMVTGDDVTGLLLTQAAMEVTVQATLSPLTGL